MILRDDILAVRDIGFLSVEIKGDTKVIKNCFNRKNSSLNSIILLMEDVWRIFLNSNMVNCCYLYGKANIIVDCLIKNDNCNAD